MKTVFEYSCEGKRCATIRSLEVDKYELDKAFVGDGADIPQISEVEFARHYTELSLHAFGVDNGFYPLGSCTMKYNPKINEEVAAYVGFTNVHPLQSIDTIQGSLEAIATLSADLAEITGMDAVTLQPCAGAHGEYTGLQLIRAYHHSRLDFNRTKIIVPDSAHGTNPASACMAGFEVINVPSNDEKGVDLDALRAAVGEDTAALMLTNPTTLGLFERNISEISQIVHDAGGLLYYDGANLNAIMGVVRPGDMGFDVVHLNLHKTFSTPHGGGGPGSGPVGCKSKLSKFLPNPMVVKGSNGYEFVSSEDSIGKVTSFYGNFGVAIKALAYVKTLGAEGIKLSAEHAVLNANYLKAKIKDCFPCDTDRYCMHEFVVSLAALKEQTGVSALDVAKSMIDNGIHPPTMYFPTIVHEALMFEPTETEPKATLDEAAEVLCNLYNLAQTDGASMHTAPHCAYVGRPDEVKAARTPIVKK